jgi:O-antigen/teichoic acid export membrane protein
MTLRRSIVRGSLSVGGGEILNQTFRFIRNVIVARIVSPADFGIAATLVLTVELLEKISNLASEVLLVQADDGDSPRFQATSQLIKTFRGLISGVVLFFLAYPVSQIFGSPEAEWAFRWLAIIPVTLGFVHDDFNRLQREMRFTPMICVAIIPSAVSLLAAYPVVSRYGDYAGLLWLLIIERITYTIVTHLVAVRWYSWAFDRDVARRIAVFGWPLLLNGVFMFGIYQGERLIIGSSGWLFDGPAYTKEDLGVYSIPLSLCMSATSMLSFIIAKVFFPVMTRAKHSLREFTSYYAMYLQATTLASVIPTVVFILAGGNLIVLIYGVKYEAAKSIIGWLAAMLSVRMIRGAPTGAALAQGDSRTSLIANVVRTGGFVAVVVVASMHSPLSWIACTGFFAELAALAVCLTRLARVHSIPFRASMKPVLFSTGVFLVAGLLSRTELVSAGWVLSGVILTSLIGVSVLVAFFSWEEFRKEVLIAIEAAGRFGKRFA